MDMGINPLLLGIMALLFLVGMVLLWKILGKPLVKVIDDRSEKIRSDLAKAEAAKDEIEKLKVEYAEKLDDIEQRAADIIAKATQDANSRAQRILARNQQEIERSRVEALADLELQRKKAVASVKGEIADLAIDVAKNVLSREVSKEDHQRFIDDLISEVGNRSN